MRFLTRDERQQAPKTKRQEITSHEREVLNQLGPEAVASMNPEAKTPNMPASGTKRPLVYILGEAPGAEEDAAGVQFVGRSGQLLRGCIPAAYEKKIRWNNTVQTRPPANRTPTDREVEAFRRVVVADIEETKPPVLVTVGAVATKWALSMGAKIMLLRGRRIPTKIGKHTCWVCPVLHPAFILRQGGGRDTRHDIYRESLRRDLDAAFTLATGDEDAKVESWDQYSLKEGVTICRSPRDVEEELDRFSLAGPIAIDIETSTLRPYEVGAKILTLAIGDYGAVSVIPIDHPSAGWSPEARQRILDAIKKWLSNKKQLIIQNAPFELEWFVSVFGPEIVRAREWHDTLVQAYCLDERKGGHSLDFLTRQYFGVAVKSLVPVNHKKLEDEPLERLAIYNATDVRFTSKLFPIQQALLKKQKLTRIYEDQLRRIPTLVMTQVAGVCVDQTLARRMSKEYSDRIYTIQKAIMKDPIIVEYTSKFGAFQPTSTQHLNKLFKNMLKRDEGVRVPTEKRKTDYSVDKNALEKMADLPIAKLILELRQLAKLKSTYVDVLLPEDDDYIVFPDGRLHTEFSSTATVTGRLGSSGPNLQNQPKRKNVEVRKLFIPNFSGTKEKYFFVDADYGQIEARVIAIASKDKLFTKAVWEGYDVHREWAERIAKAWPKTFEKRGSNIDSFRSDIKNQWTFPLFYGASITKCATLLEMPESLTQKLYDEFWTDFAGVREWQGRLIKFYRNNAYVETLSGRRRRGPLSKNKILNTPIQGGASDIVLDAMNRLSEAAAAQEKHWLQPVLQVHDQIVFTVPESKLEDGIVDIVRAMTSTSYDWVSIPLEIDVSYGPNWCDLTKIGKFDSRKPI